MCCHLCKYCGAITNILISAQCEASPTGVHDWVSGEEVEDQLQMLWERTPASVGNASD